MMGDVDARRTLVRVVMLVEDVVWIVRRELIKKNQG